MRIGSISSNEVGTDLQIAVFKQGQDQVKAQAAGLLQMMTMTTLPPATVPHLGKHVDVRV